LKNPTEKILSAGFFYPLAKSLACGAAWRGGRQGRLCFFATNQL
jgi:hypothetical protein